MPELTKVSSKGQVVIPSGIRKELGIKEGTQLVVGRIDGFILFKKVAIPNPQEEFKKLTRWGTKFAKKKGIKSEEDIMRIIHASRGVKDA